MKFEFQVGKTEVHRVEFFRSSMVGTMWIKIDGVEIATNSAFDPLTHVSVELKKRHTFIVGSAEQHEVTIEHERPLIFAGFRPHNYRVYVDGVLIDEHRGY